MNSKSVKNDFAVAREYNATTRIPEEMSVGELNQAVRDLREMLYQSQLRFQNHSGPACWDDE